MAAVGTTPRPVRQCLQRGSPGRIGFFSLTRRPQLRPEPGDESGLKGSPPALPAARGDLWRSLAPRRPEEQPRSSPRGSSGPPAGTGPHRAEEARAGPAPLTSIPGPWVQGPRLPPEGVTSLLGGRPLVFNPDSAPVSPGTTRGRALLQRPGVQRMVAAPRFVPIQLRGSRPAAAMAQARLSGASANQRVPAGPAPRHRQRWSAPA
ncbi:hypothetical protein NDU88_005150 [Pleurodeles waltl]|uniref:Uncharacterized protein n=1 Tax=Pleurodeles waltl TaxID=8319 RepID=A0AAV7TT69_PLEWA|nr:hypothetical protein NDU88_005150 [Pleurodeles waltl]